MNILIISYDLASITLACKLAEEGNDVKIYERIKSWKNKIKRPQIKFVDNWKKELNWVGKNGLILFDYTGMGEEQEELRKAGYKVFGGSVLGEKVEDNRQYGQKIFSSVGMKLGRSKDFYDINEMIDFLKEQKGKWVVKQNGFSADKGLNYVGCARDASDVISILKNYKKILGKQRVHFDLQEKVEGIEIALGRYFNGKDWVGPICINIEHKGLFNGGLGPKGEEMGSLVWYEKKENKLFNETIGRMKNFLSHSNYRGYFDIDFIVNNEGAYPLESTSRLAYPTTQAQTSLLISPWGEFLKAIAEGKDFNLKYKDEYCVLVFVGVPPYPYKNLGAGYSPSGLGITFKKPLNKEEIQSIYFEEFSVAEKDKKISYEMCGETGYAIHVTGIGKSIDAARTKVYSLVDKIVIPKMFYRTDIGLSFAKKDLGKLKKWGWL
jgi:phosphoribosylamine--glycine ligase